MADEKKQAGDQQTGPVIFALDTSSKFTSMAVARGGRITACLGARAGENRSERLWAWAEFLLAEAGHSVNDVDLFSVCVGPGGFTGLRIGVAAIKGFAVATGRPVVGVTSLEATAAAAGRASNICVLLNAARSDFYSQLFSNDNDSIPEARDAPFIAPREEALSRIADMKDVVLIGDLTEDLLEAKDEPEKRLIIKRPPVLLAEQVARLSYLKLLRQETQRPEELRACYVRPSEAEVKLSLGLIGAGVRKSKGLE